MIKILVNYFFKKKLIKQYNPIQINENIEVIHVDKVQILRVIDIKLYGVDWLGFPGEKLSFSYKGMPLKKNGKLMENRKAITFNNFIKNGIKYYMPSYFWIEIVPARMY